MFAAFSYIWLCGPAASGKTTVLRALHQQLPPGQVEYLNDSLEMVDFIKRDTGQRHHTRPTPNSFILSDSEPVQYSVEQIIGKLLASPKKALIEISRGLDREGKIDFSYESLFSRLSKEIKEKSLFLYLYTPFAERLDRNRQRPLIKGRASVLDSFHCPPPAMERFFQVDDFFTAISRHQVAALVIPNLDSESALTVKITALF